MQPTDSDLSADITELQKTAAAASERCRRLEILNDRCEAENAALRGKIKKLESAFQERLSQLEADLEKLRTQFPLKALLAAKDQELERLCRAVERISPDHPERREIEVLVREHYREREELARLVQDACEVFESQAQRIRAAGE